MKNRIIYIVALFVLVSACKKKVFEPFPDSSTPVFSMEGDFAGQNISYFAGDNGMEMTSGLEIRNGVQYAFAQFSNGSKKYKIGLFDGNTALPLDQNSISIGDTLFFAQKTTQQLAYLSLSQLSNYYKFSNVEWYANDVYLGNNSVSITDPGVYDVTGIFTFNDAGQTTRTVTNRMYLGFQNDLPISLHHYLSDPNELKVWTEGDLQDVDSIQWYIDNEFIWTGLTCTKNINPAVQNVKAKVFYSNQAVLEKTIVVDGSFEGRYIEDFSVFQAPDQSTLWDYSVGFEVEENGQTYSSFDVPNYKGSFVVRNMNLYTHPITGVEMIRIEADIDAKLKSNTSGEVINSMLHVIFGFPRPE
jgi:hypothetical protein